MTRTATPMTIVDRLEMARWGTRSVTIAHTDAWLQCVAAVRSGATAAAPPAAAYATAVDAPIVAAIATTARRSHRRQAHTTAAAAASSADTFTSPADASSTPASTGRCSCSLNTAASARAPTTRSLWPPLTMPTTTTGLSTSRAMAAGDTPRRHSMRAITTRAAADSPWNASRASSVDAPATDISAAETAVKSGPYTDGVCRHPTNG